MKASLCMGVWPLSSDCEADGNISLIYREDDTPIAAIALESFDPVDPYVRVIRIETLGTHRRKGLMSYLFDVIERHGLSIQLKVYNNRIYDDSFLKFLEDRAEKHSDSKTSHVIKIKSDSFISYCFVDHTEQTDDPWHSLFRSIR